MANKELVYLSDVRRTLLRYEPEVAYVLNGIRKVDAVEVVRCKDCKHRGSAYCPMETVEFYPWFATKNDAFCSYGERRTNEAG